MNLVQLICTDLDGTLLDSRGDLSPGSLEAITTARRSGIAVVCVTGRPVRDTLTITRRYGLTGPVVCSNGAVTVDAESGSPLLCRGFDPAECAELLSVLEAGLPGLIVGIESIGGLYLEEGFAQLVPDCWPHQPVSAARTVLHPDDPVVKILAIHPDLTTQALERAIVDLVGDRLEVTRSTGRFVELSARGVDKGQALHWLTRHLSVPPARTAAVGDMPNDIPMLRAAGLAAAVANAHPDVRRAAHVVLPSNDDDGVAALIRRSLR
ncbi:Cof subfamily protein (haloacid dehalogenase superfamily) [Kitasatospora sp. MAA4]|uniref:HAD family hydrolase n=1 Tax=Kitasatospora sp. MAA4 TaxID=3035093 RepID=UPI002475EC99|nr:HAD family hydrolase [Kitasatospora sp. MAA4]MDH6134220.1 Cof subfamily protein (haloacid dehalogenase superfamily) [Kitasatospora sp. MAA4]